jgi:hypothetical protein
LIPNWWWGSVGVGGEVAADVVDVSVFPEQPVVPDAGGECEQSERDAGGDAEDGAAAVALERECVFEGVVGRFDPLAYPSELPEPGWLALRSGRWKFAPSPAISCSNSSPAKPLSAITV